MTDPQPIEPKQLRRMIVEYVCSLRHGGVMLPYEDYCVIDEWIAQTSVTDQLLLILHDVLPDYFEKARASSSAPPPSLRGVRNRVLASLQSQ